MKALLFDLDLTLVNTGGAGLRALAAAFEEVLGLRDALRGVLPDGKTDPAIVREACLRSGVRHDAALTGQILERYVHLLEAEVEGARNYRVLPGVPALVDEIRCREDVCFGLATGNVEAGARIKLGPSGLNAYFAFGGFGSDSEDRIEVVRTAARLAGAATGTTPDPAETFVVGDTPRDIAAGRQAGFRTVGVATGHHSVEALERAGADLVVEDLERGRDQFMRSTRIV